MTIAFVGQGKTYAFATTSRVTRATSGGDTLIVAVQHQAQTSGVSITDSAGNTWTRAGTTIGISGVPNVCLTSLYYCINATATAWVQANIGGANALGVNVSEWSGIVGIGTTSASVGGTAQQTVAVNAGDLVFGQDALFLTTAPWTGGTLTAGFTALTESDSGVSNASVLFSAYQIVGSAGTYGPAWSGGGVSSAANNNGLITAQFLAAFPVTGAQAITVGQSAVAAVTKVATASQAISVGQSASASVVKSVTAAQTIAVGQSAAAVAFKAIAAAQPITVGQGATATTVQPRAASQAITVTQSATILVGFFRTAAQPITFGQAAAVTVTPPPSPFRNYDITKLILEVDNRPFTVGSSALGEAAIGVGAGWESILGSFQSISATRSVSIENGALFGPESAKMTLTTEDPISSAAVYNKAVRLRYGTTVLFQGKVDDWSDAMTPGDILKPIEHSVSLDASDRTDLLAKLVLYGWTPAQQTGTVRAPLAYPSVVATLLSRTMPAKAASNPTALSVLQDIADANFARFYVKADNTVVIDASPPPGTGIIFVDDNTPAGPGDYNIDYTKIGVRQSADDVVTGVAVTVASDNTKTAYNAVTAVLTNEVALTVDILPTSIEVNAYADSYPLQPFASVIPTAITPKVTLASLAQVVGIELLDMVTVNNQGTVYESGIGSIKHSITPDHWSTDFDLVPGYLIDHPLVFQPAPVTGFKTTSRTDTSISLAWTPPQSVLNITGYELRRIAGTVAPANRTLGTLVATIPLGTNTYTNTGLTHQTAYAYALFSLTADSLVFSKPAGTSTYTASTASSAVRALAVASHTGGNAVLTWTVPAAPADAAFYKVEGTSVAGFVPQYVTRTVPFGTNTATLPTIIPGSYVWTVTPLCANWHGSQVPGAAQFVTG